MSAVEQYAAAVAVVLRGAATAVIELTSSDPAVRSAAYRALLSVLKAVAYEGNVIQVNVDRLFELMEDDGLTVD